MFVYEWNNPCSQLLGITDEYMVRALGQMILKVGILFAQNLEGGYEAFVNEVRVACLDDHVGYVAYATIQLLHKPNAGWKERVMGKSRVAEYVKLFRLVRHSPHTAIDQWKCQLFADRRRGTPARLFQLSSSIELWRWRGQKHALHTVGQVADVETAALVGYGE